MIKTLDTKYIEDKGNGTFRIRFRIPSKKLYFSKQISNSTIDEAIAIRDDALKELEDKGKIDSTMKVKDCVKLWMVQVVKIKNEGSTIDDKISKLTNHFLPYLGNLQMCDVKRNDIQDWIVTLTDKKSMRYNDGTFEKLSPTTIHNVYSIVRAFFNWASDEDINIINMTPCRKIELPKRKDYEKEILEGMDIDEVIEYILELPVQYQCAFLMPLFCGLRCGEVVGLRWKDIDFNKKQIRVNKSLSISKSKGTDLKLTKSNKSRTVRMNDLIIDLLLQLKEEQNFLKKTLGKNYKKPEMVFTNDFGYYLSPNSIGNRWRRFRDKHGLKHVTYHGLRASYASLLLHDGISIKEIQESLGHSEARTTTKYYTCTYDDDLDRIYNVTNKFHK